ncbi:MAG: esterase-like activity of phytase family protein [Gammaproteobacteria bacterium]|nr:esterase-like activity of phytase family protein [Gammaproteobacteria bacterium]
MKITKRTTAGGSLIGVFALSVALATPAYAANELTGWALMPANTFAPGPSSGQFTSTAFPVANPLPLINKQPVQGLSAVLRGPTADSYRVMPDNGFGAITNSADALLRMYAVAPRFKSFDGSAVIGSGTVDAVNFASGATLASFDSSSFINLRDPDHKLGFSLVADKANYPNGGNNIPVDSSIKSERLLTGSDFDIEAVRQDKHGNLWFGDEFGPFLVKTDASGKVLRQEIAMPGVQSPQNPFLGGGTPTLGRSSGFEGMAINPAGDKLYTLLEGTVAGDAPKSLRINEFDVEAETYTSVNFLYQLDAKGTNIGDMTAVDDHRFLVIERNNDTATIGTPFKKIFLADTTGVANGGVVKKTELVDLMNIADPHDLNGDGATTFTFPFVTIEDVLLLDASTLLVINDNNYPGGGGRGAFADNTEFLRIGLAQPVPVPGGAALLAPAMLALVRVTRRSRG